MVSITNKQANIICTVDFDPEKSSQQIKVQNEKKNFFKNVPKRERKMSVGLKY